MKDMRLLLISFLLSYILLDICIGVSGSSHDNEYDVIILGAGMSGVTAAKTLVEDGITNFVILEAKDKVGGRMQSVQFGDVTINIGLEWVHLAGDDSTNPLYIATKEYNVSGAYTDWDDFIAFNETGHDVTEEAEAEMEILDAAFDGMHAYGEKLWANQYRDDISLRGSLRWFGFNPKTAVQMALDFFYTDYESAEQASLLSNRYFVGDAIEGFGEEDYLLTDTRGASIIVQKTLEKVPDWESKTKLETVVHTIDYSGDHVLVETNKGNYTAKKVICTFSTGVLHNSPELFKPDFPEWKLQALHAYGMNDYIHIFIRFDINIPWFIPDDTEWIMYASERKGYFPVWQNLNKIYPNSRIMNVAVASTEARRLQRATDEQVMSEMMAVLRNMFGNIPQAIEVYVPRWNLDPFFQGSYSDWPVGYTRAQHKALKSNLGDLYFAGEAYSVFYYGYSHAALLSGKATAADVARCLKDESACPEPYIPPYEALGCTYKRTPNYDAKAQIDDGSCMIITQAPTSEGNPFHCQNMLQFLLIVTILLAY